MSHTSCLLWYSGVSLLPLITVRTSDEPQPSDILWLLWPAWFECRNLSKHNLVSLLSMQRCYVGSLQHMVVLCGLTSNPQSDSCPSFVRSVTGCLSWCFLELWRTLLCFPLGFWVLARHQLLAEKCHVCSQMALIQISEELWVEQHTTGYFQSVKFECFLPVFPPWVCTFLFLLIGNYLDGEEPSVWSMEESTSTCLYGVLLLQCDQSRGVLGRREGSCKADRTLYLQVGLMTCWAAAVKL